MMQKALNIAAIGLALLLSACATPGAPIAAGTPCEARGFAVVDDFPTARRGTCTVLAANRVKIEIRREDERVRNPSPWFAFKLLPNRPASARVVLDYGTWGHRYWPKISNDGRNWRPVEPENVRGEAKARQIELRVPLDGHPVWISAQEILTPEDYAAWVGATVDRGDATVSVLGESAAGRPIHLLDSGGPAQRLVLFTGRQHPPEISGAHAFKAFVETVLGASPLAQRFRAEFRVLSIPLLNPDGVVSGHWRHNLGAIDLNRDWGPFTQPETRLVAGLLDRLDDEGQEIAAFVDFHSTNRNLFYTQTDDEGNRLPGFEKTWLDRSRPRLVNYEFDHVPRPTSPQANSKNYMFQRYGVPSVTYEVGDETSREATAAAAVIFAEEFMRLLLESMR